MKSILLLHGWNYKDYTSLTDSKDAWNKRKRFVKKINLGITKIMLIMYLNT